MWGTNQTEKLKVNTFTQKHGYKTLSDWKYNITEWNVVIFSKQYPPWTRCFRACFKTTIEESACFSTKPIYLLDFLCLLVDYHYCSRFFNFFYDQRKPMIKENELHQINYFLTCTNILPKCGIYVVSACI